MNRETIKRLNGGAARLLLVLLTCDGTETLSDLPNLIKMAGLSHTDNSHGKNRYARAFQQLKDLGFIKIEGRSINIPFEDLLRGPDNERPDDAPSHPFLCELCSLLPPSFEIDWQNEQDQTEGVLACPVCTDHVKRGQQPCALVIPIACVLSRLIKEKVNG